MRRYLKETEPGTNRLDERFNPPDLNLRTHWAPKKHYQIPENETEFVRLRGYNDLQYVLHVHESGLTIKKARELANKEKPGHHIKGIEICDPPVDNEGNQGGLIILKPESSDIPFDPTPLFDFGKLLNTLMPEPKLTEQPPAPEKAPTPGLIGRMLYAAFEGYDSRGQPSEQLSYMLENYFILPCLDGYPVYGIPTPEMDEPVGQWRENRFIYTMHTKNHATTDKHTPESPYIDPASLHHPDEIITVTSGHHFFQMFSIDQGRDFLFTRSNGSIAPFSYFKSEEPIEPRALHADGPLLGSIWVYARPMIQLWKYQPLTTTYQLQAALRINTISFAEFIQIMGTKPEKLL